MEAPTYRERLRVEGLTLAGSGAAASAALLALAPQARRGPPSTIVQLALVAVAVVVTGPRSARKAMDESRRLRVRSHGAGAATALWQLPLIVVGQAALFKLLERLPTKGAQRAGWDASLRAVAGSALVGLGQAVVVERTVAADEEARNRTYYRLEESRLGATKLGWRRGRR